MTQQDNSRNYSDSFKPIESKRERLSKKPSQLVEKTKSISFSIGKQRLEEKRRMITIDNLGESAYKFEIEFESALGKRSIGVYDLKKLIPAVLDYYKEAFYWGLNRKEVHQHLIKATLSERKIQFAWLDSQIHNKNTHYWVVFDITTDPPLAIGHANMKPQTADGRDINGHSLGQVIYEPKYFGKNRLKQEHNKSIGYQMLAFEIRAAKKAGITKIVGNTENDNIPVNRLLSENKFILNGKTLKFIKVDGRTNKLNIVNALGKVKKMSTYSLSVPR